MTDLCQRHARDDAGVPYKCALCAVELHAPSSSFEQAMAETERVHGRRPTGRQLESPYDASTDLDNDYCVICDDCWQAYLQWAREQGIAAGAEAR